MIKTYPEYQVYHRPFDLMIEVYDPNGIPENNFSKNIGKLYMFFKLNLIEQLSNQKRENARQGGDPRKVVFVFVFN